MCVVVFVVLSFSISCSPRTTGLDVLLFGHFGVSVMYFRIFAYYRPRPRLVVISVSRFTSCSIYAQYRPRPRIVLMSS